MNFIRSSILRSYAVATEVKRIDLPTNPLSHLSITMDFYNATDEATLAEVLAFINSISVTHLGSTVLYLESEDLYALNCYLLKHSPVLTHNVATDNASRQLTLIVPFGRTLYNSSECYPATKKGELTLSLDCTIPATSLDNAQFNIEAVELVGAAPTQYLKSTLKNVVAPGATGDIEVDLPIGNQIVALLMFSTTTPADSTHIYGINASKILVDNVEFGYAFASAHALVGDWVNRLHTGARSIAASGEIDSNHFFAIDFDPVSNGAFLLDTKGKSRVIVRNTMAVNEASKINVVELVNVGG